MYTYRLNPGGLYRCCIDSIDAWEVEHEAESTLDPMKRVVIGCKYHQDKDLVVAVRENGTWRSLRAEEIDGAK